MDGDANAIKNKFLELQRYFTQKLDCDWGWCDMNVINGFKYHTGSDNGNGVDGSYWAGSTWHNNFDIHSNQNLVLRTNLYCNNEKCAMIDWIRSYVYLCEYSGSSCTPMNDYIEASYPYMYIKYEQAFCYDGFCNYEQAYWRKYSKNGWFLNKGILYRPPSIIKSGNDYKIDQGMARIQYIFLKPLPLGRYKVCAKGQTEDPNPHYGCGYGMWEPDGNPNGDGTHCKDFYSIGPDFLGFKDYYESDLSTAATPRYNTSCGKDYCEPFSFANYTRSISTSSIKKGKIINGKLHVPYRSKLYFKFLLPNKSKGYMSRFFLHRTNPDFNEWDNFPDKSHFKNLYYIDGRYDYARKVPKVRRHTGTTPPALPDVFFNYDDSFKDYFIAEIDTARPSIIPPGDGELFFSIEKRKDYNFDNGNIDSTFNMPVFKYKIYPAYDRYQTSTNVVTNQARFNYYLNGSRDKNNIECRFYDDCSPNASDNLINYISEANSFNKDETIVISSKAFCDNIELCTTGKVKHDIYLYKKNSQGIYEPYNKTVWVKTGFPDNNTKRFDSFESFFGKQSYYRMNSNYYFYQYFVLNTLETGNYKVKTCAIIFNDSDSYSNPCAEKYFVVFEKTGSIHNVRPIWQNEGLKNEDYENTTPRNYFNDTTIKNKRDQLIMPLRTNKQFMHIAFDLAFNRNDYGNYVYLLFFNRDQNIRSLNTLFFDAFSYPQYEKLLDKKSNRDDNLIRLSDLGRYDAAFAILRPESPANYPKTYITSIDLSKFNPGTHTIKPYVIKIKSNYVKLNSDLYYCNGVFSLFLRGPLLFISPKVNGYGVFQHCCSLANFVNNAYYRYCDPYILQGEGFYSIIEGPNITLNIRPDTLPVEFEKPSHEANKVDNIALKWQLSDSKIFSNSKINFARLELTDANDATNKVNIMLDNGDAANPQVLDGTNAAFIEPKDNALTLKDIGLPIITDAVLKMIDRSYENKNCKSFDPEIDTKTANEIDPKDGLIYCQTHFTNGSGGDLKYKFTSTDDKMVYQRYNTTTSDGKNFEALEEIVPFQGKLSGDNFDSINRKIALNIDFLYKSTSNAYYNYKNEPYKPFLYKAKVQFKDANGTIIDKDEDGNYLGKFAKISSEIIKKVPDSNCGYTPKYAKNTAGWVEIGGCFTLDYDTKNKAMWVAKKISEMLYKEQSLYFNLKKCVEFSDWKSPTYPIAFSTSGVFDNLWYGYGTWVPYFDDAFKENSTRKIRGKDLPGILYLHPEYCVRTNYECKSCKFDKRIAKLRLKDVIDNKIYNIYRDKNITFSFAYPKISKDDAFMKQKYFTMQLERFEFDFRGYYPNRFYNNISRKHKFAQTGIYFSDVFCNNAKIENCSVLDLNQLSKNVRYYFKDKKVPVEMDECTADFRSSYKHKDDPCFVRFFFAQKIANPSNFDTQYKGKIQGSGGSMLINYHNDRSGGIIRDVIYFNDPDDAYKDSYTYSNEYSFSIQRDQDCSSGGCTAIKRNP